MSSDLNTALRHLAAGLDAELEPIGDGGRLVAEREGRRFTALVGRYDPPAARGLEIVTSLDHADGPAAGAGGYRQGRATIANCPGILMRAETLVDRVGKRIGLNREVQTGDAAFDDRVYAESDGDPEVVRAILSEPVRVRVVALLDAGCWEVGLQRDGKQQLVRRPLPAPEELEDVYLATLSGLADLAEALPAFASLEPASSARTRRIVDGVMLALLAAGCSR